MKILQRYITVNLLWATGLALFALMSLFAFFTLVDQLEDTGRGSYGVAEAVMFVILSMPGMAYEVFPIAAVIGGMSVLGILARYNELDVILAAGVSKHRLAWTLARASLPLIAVAVLLGEGIAPVSEQAAQSLRSISLTEQITMRTRYGFWIRDANSYINVRRVLPDNRLEDIFIYEFDDRHRLRASMHAEGAVYAGGAWTIEGARVSRLGEDKVDTRMIDRMTRDTLLNPEIINVVAVKPRYLTLPGLIGYIDYLSENAQNTLLYEQALWSKLVAPFSILALILLAVPLVQGRSWTIGQRVFSGALAGICFHLVNQVSANLGVVYQAPPVLSVLTPTLLLFLLIGILLRR